LMGLVFLKVALFFLLACSGAHVDRTDAGQQ
jgi:hypothetical protein